MEEFLRVYGYLALSVGTFVEGETAILVASSLVSSGTFNGLYTVIFGFFGSFLSDWPYYLIGRISGKNFVKRRPSLQNRMGPARQFFNQHRVQVLLTYRFLYGFRILLPVMIGMSDVRPLKFLGNSFGAGMLWATTATCVGYAAGIVFGLTPQSFEEHLPLVILGFCCFGLLIGYAIRRLAEAMLGNPGT